MNQEQVIALAREAGFKMGTAWYGNTKVLERFAALVAEAERQRTVETLMELHRKADGQHNYYHFAANEIRGFSV